MRKRIIGELSDGMSSLEDEEMVTIRLDFKLGI